MKIIEQRVTGKAGQELCEDGIAVNEHFIAVIDGSTSKTERQIINDMPNGKACMKAVIDYINSIPYDTDLDEFCIGATAYIKNIYDKAGIDAQTLKDEPEQRMAASAIVYSRHFRQIWMVGDCQCLINGKLHTNPKPKEKFVAAKRAEAIRKALADGVTEEEIRKDDIGRKAIGQELKMACKQQNITYAVIDGFCIPMEKIVTIQLKYSHNEIVLASDGYPILESTLDKSEEQLHRLIIEDPLCISENLATKGLTNGRTSFDDRSYIRFED